MHNTSALSNKKTDLLSIREAKRKSPKKYVNCKLCFGRVQKRNFFRHRKNCGKGQEGSEGVVKCKKSLSFDLKDDDFYSEVLDSMKDGLNEKILEDSTMYSFGRNLWEIKGFRKVRAIRGKLRDSQRLLEKMRDITNNQNLTWLEIIHVKQVENLIQAIKGIVHFGKKGKDISIDAPSTAILLIRIANDMADFLLTEFCKKEQTADIDNVNRFLKLFKNESNKKIRHHADRTLKRQKREKPDALPLSSDIAKLADYAKSETEHLMSDLKESRNEESYHRLVKNILFRLTTFNRRRGGAVEKLKISEYLRPTDVMTSVSEEIMAQLAPDELKILKTTKLIEVEHKCDNFVPILVTPEVQNAIELLLKYRHFADVASDNLYVFPAKKGSLNPVRGSEVLRTYRGATKISRPDAFTATG